MNLVLYYATFHPCPILPVIDMSHIASVVVDVYMQRSHQWTQTPWCCWQQEDGIPCWSQDYCN